MTGTGGKLQQLNCYHPFSDSMDIYLTKNHSENYSPKMVPIAKIWGSGSWTNGPFAKYVKLEVAHAPGMPDLFSPPPRVSDPDMHYGACVTHVV